MSATLAFFVGYFVGMAAILFAVAFGQAAAKENDALRELIKKVKEQPDVVSLDDYRYGHNRTIG